MENRCHDTGYSYGYYSPKSPPLFPVTGTSGSGSALKLTAAESSYAREDEAATDDSVAAVTADETSGLPLYKDLPDSKESAVKKDSSQAPASDETPKPESGLASDEEVITALMLSV